ncbi:MAG: hypothetical protein GQ534_07950 [Candidatus Delongbacteria bacterium]|nr:hypothetical protein [Candidatus Delongbacteria bacterium]
MKPVIIKISNKFAPEKEYVFNFIFKDILGINIALIKEDRTDHLIELPNGKSIKLLDDFFNHASEDYIKPENIPHDVKMLNFGQVAELPIIFGSEQIFINDNDIKCGFDIISSIFFMLSRWEEVAITEKDEHGRLPGKLSLAVKNNFIDRPIVNEYILLLRSFIEELDPTVVMKENEGRITLTSDIDDFRKYSNFNIFKKLAGDLLKRHSPKMFYRNFREFCMKFLLNTKDPYDTFEELFELAELTTEQPIFFIPTAAKCQFDTGWFAKNKGIVNTAKFIQDNGGVIGLHYGYDSMGSVEKIRAEKELLDKKLNVKVDSVRAHFLRFNVEYSFDDLVSSGITKDYSLGYSKYAGFRCGTSYPFKAWNFKTRKPYDIEVHPLIVMDATLNSHQEMSKNEIAAVVKKYRNLVGNFGGNLVLLLHNSSPKDVFEAFRKGLK